MKETSAEFCVWTIDNLELRNFLHVLHNLTAIASSFSPAFGPQGLPKLKGLGICLWNACGGAKVVQKPFTSLEYVNPNDVSNYFISARDRVYS